MPIYTNCEKYHCSRARPDNSLADDIAVHLTITTKPKYPIISKLVNICEPGLDGVDGCPMWLECDRNQKTKPARVEG